MPEPLIHFVIPFASLGIMGIRPKKAFLPSIIALTPDLDALVGIHRSPTHSLIMIGIAASTTLILLRGRPAFRFGLISVGAVLSHILLDLFQTYTPALWPLYDKYIWIKVTLDTYSGGSIGLPSILVLMKNPTQINSNLNILETPQEYIYTTEGIILSAALLAITMSLLWLRKKKYLK
ncbi:MAG: metal-dependent hydrolase [Candidatus Hydrothermarchaeales archaeon]